MYAWGRGRAHLPPLHPSHKSDGGQNFRDERSWWDEDKQAEVADGQLGRMSAWLSEADHAFMRLQPAQAASCRGQRTGLEKQVSRSFKGICCGWAEVCHGQ